MHSIYHAADRVLVLEASILAGSTETASPIQLLLNIRYSKWMNRLWTFQEGALANELFFQFSNRALRPDDLVQLAVEDSERADQHRSLRLRFSHWRIVLADVLLNPIMTCLDFLRRDFLFYPSHARPSELAEKLSVSLAWRTTSRSTDETLCLASLLNLPHITIRQLATYDDAGDRMRLLLLSLATISAVVLFIRRPRLAVPGARWMPTSFLGGGRAATIIERDANAMPARITADGLEIVRPGFMCTVDVAQREGFLARDEHFGVFVFVAEKPSFDVAALGAVKMAVLLEWSLQAVRREEVPDSKGTRAALTMVIGSRGEQLVVQYIAVLTIMLVPIPEDADVEYSTLKMLPDGQQWLVQ